MFVDRKQHCLRPLLTMRALLATPYSTTSISRWSQLTAEQLLLQERQPGPAAVCERDVLHRCFLPWSPHNSKISGTLCWTKLKGLHAGALASIPGALISKRFGRTMTMTLAGTSFVIGGRLNLGAEPAP